MKKINILTLIIFLYFGKSFSKDLTGNQLHCDFWTKGTAQGIHFTSASEGVYYEVHKEKGWYVERREFTYTVGVDYINMTGKIYKYLPQLNRKTLKLNNSFKCQILQEKVDMDKYMGIVMFNLKQESEQKNKL